MSKKRVVLVTTHCYDSKRKAGFHNLADTLVEKGWEVCFLSIGLSYISIIGRDYRANYMPKCDRNKMVDKKNGLKSFLFFTPWHPCNLKLSILNIIAYPLFRLFGLFRLKNKELRDFIKSSDKFIFEGSRGLFFVNQFKKLNAKATFIYRVSDDLRTIHAHQSIIKEEAKVIGKFDLISVPCLYIIHSFKKLFGDSIKPQLDYHGIDKVVFDKCNINPYIGMMYKKNMVFIGNAFLDDKFIEYVAQMYPDFGIHIIGPMDNIPKAQNVIAYGEVDFKETVPYVKYADIGLVCFKYHSGAEVFTDSLKTLQYTYSELPIVAPEFIKTDRENSFYYKHDDFSTVEQSITNALKWKGDNGSLKKSINSWGDLATKLVAPLKDDSNE